MRPEPKRGLNWRLFGLGMSVHSSKKMMRRPCRVLSRRGWGRGCSCQGPYPTSGRLTPGLQPKIAIHMWGLPIASGAKHGPMGPADQGWFSCLLQRGGLQKYPEIKQWVPQAHSLMLPEYWMIKQATVLNRFAEATPRAEAAFLFNQSVVIYFYIIITCFDLIITHHDFA